MSKLKIAFQGEPGANSHIAIVEAYPDAEPLPCATFEDALSAISSGEADLGIMGIVHADTAGSARDISERKDKTVAAIASRLAAQIYGLDILAEDIEDEAHNTTRFVVLAREPKWAAQGSGPLVTTFVFRVRNLPAALYKALGGFATNGVNMTKLESYMVDGNFFATQFYADVDGHPEDKGLAFAIEELKFFSREFRIVGVYPGHPFRATME